ncbi:MAG TPA: Glu-tRNA(Gln) amidotransferase subunit GatD [archaeon]|nr:Glu-tRNA(Gln) amidotransferase subunit GatD [archaeon]
MVYDNQQVEIRMKDGRRLEGVALPSTDFSDKSILIVKLKNGYNVGLSRKDILRVERRGRVEGIGRMGGVGNMLKGKPSTGTRDVPPVGVLGTGGTVASRVDYVTGGVRASMTAEEILAFVPEVAEFADIKFVNLFSKLSEDMCPQDWPEIVRATARLLRQTEGVVVLHGTDTLHYTAAALAFMLTTSKPVVLTGAQRSSDRPSTDAFLNIQCGLRTALSDLGEPVVCFHSSTSDGTCDLMRATRTRKMHTSARAAFRSINTPVLARMDRGGKLEKLADYLLRSKGPAKVKVDVRLEPEVALVKVHPGADPRILKWYAQRGYKGVVLEGTGLGHVPVSPSNGRSWMPVIQKLAGEMAVVMTSQTIYGRTHPFVYTNLRELSQAGVIFAGDTLPETAMVKLMWVLGHTQKLEKVARQMQTNIKGELNPRTLEISPPSQ